MIIIWPLIVSKTVNPNILPGVCKALEKYIYINELDDIIETANKNIRDKQKSSNRKNKAYSVLRNINGMLTIESVDYNPADFLEEARTKTYSTNQQYDDQNKQTGYSTTDTTQETDPEGEAEARAKGSQKGTDHQKQAFDTAQGKAAGEEAAGRTPYQTAKDQAQAKFDVEKGKKNTTYKDAYATAKAKADIDKRDAYKDAYDAAKAKADVDKLKSASPEIGKIDSSSINTEPTWNTVVDQEGRTTAIGVKVVPFIINNEQSLIKLMTQDRYRSGLSIAAQIQSRKLLRIMYHIANKTWSSTIGKLFSWTGLVGGDFESSTISQNWKNDIILQNTAFKEKMFILLNKMDLEEDFMGTAKGVKKLFGLGWTSFVVADDMNKVVHFCMNKYKGMCSMVNYGFLYSDGRSHHQVYQDIEDIRKSSGPLFRMKRPKKSMINDNLAIEKLDDYSKENVLNESFLNNEMISKFENLMKNKPRVLASNLKSISSAIKRQDYKLAGSIVEKLVPINKITNINRSIDNAISSNSELKKNFDLSSNVFKNSLPELSNETVKVGAYLISSFILLTNNKNYNIKNDLKNIVMRTREKAKTWEEDEEQFKNELEVAFYFALLGIIFGGAIAVSSIYALIAVFPFLHGLITFAGIVLGLVMCLRLGLVVLNNKFIKAD